MSDRLRIIVLVVAVVVGLGVAAIPLVASLSGGGGTAPTASTTSAAVGGDTTDAADTDDAASGPVDPVGTRYSVADPVACPTGTTTPSQEAELSGVTLPCLTDGGSVGETDLAGALAGKPTLVNVWAWWCQPCRAELSVLQEAAEKHPEWNIVGVHADGQGQAGADLLQDLDVRLASFQDSDGALAAAAELPSVIPLSVIYRADGTRVALHPGEITSVAELEEIMSDAV